MVLRNSFDVVGPNMQVFPDYIKETNYQDITDQAHTLHQKAFNAELPAFLWFQTRPDLLAHFNQFMAARHVGMPTWFNVYLWKDKTEGLKLEQPFFIDVGGGIGHQSVALREKVPELPIGSLYKTFPPL